MRSAVKSQPSEGCHSPAVFNVLVDAAGDEHGEEGVVPGADEHQGKAETHPKEGEGPSGHGAQTRPTQPQLAPGRLPHKQHLSHDENLPLTAHQPLTLSLSHP